MPRTELSNDLANTVSAPLGARCRKCGYSIEYLPEKRCPECFTEFNLDDPTTFVVPNHHKEGFVPWCLLCLCILASAISIVSRDRNNYIWILGLALQSAVIIAAAHRMRRSRSIAAILYWLSLVIAVGAALYSWAVPRLH